MSRRRLLATGAAAGVANATHSGAVSAATEHTVDVAVVGGGLSGLIAARTLLQP